MVTMYKALFQIPSCIRPFNSHNFKKKNFLINLHFVTKEGKLIREQLTFPRWQNQDSNPGHVA